MEKADIIKLMEEVASRATTASPEQRRKLHSKLAELKGLLESKKDHDNLDYLNEK